MSTTVQPEAPTTPPAIDDQRARLVLEAEVWKDIEGGPDTLCVTTDDLAAEPISPARLLGLLDEAADKLAVMRRMALEFEARDTLAAIIAEHDLHLEEWDTSTLEPRLRDGFVCFAMVHKDGRTIVVVPAGQDPVERTAAIAVLVNDLQAQAVQA